MLTLCVLFVPLFGPCAPPDDNTASLSRVVTMAKWVRRWKPISIPYGGNFQKANVEEREQKVYSYEYSDEESEYHWRDPCPDTTRLTTPATRTRVIAGHIRPESMQTPNVYMYPRTAGTLRVNYHLSLQVFLPRHCHLGSHIQLRVIRRSLRYLKDISSASPQSRKRAHQWSLNIPCSRYHSSSPIWHLSQPTSLASRRRFFLVTKKMSGGEGGPSSYLGTALGQLRLRQSHLL